LPESVSHRRTTGQVDCKVRISVSLISPTHVNILNMEAMKAAVVFLFCLLSNFPSINAGKSDDICSLAVSTRLHHFLFNDTDSNWLRVAD